MTKVHAAFTAAGFEVEGMGGNCEAYRRPIGEGYELVTLTDDPSLPTEASDRCAIGWYRSEEADDESAEMLLEVPCTDILRILPTLRPDVPLKVALMTTYAFGD